MHLVETQPTACCAAAATADPAAIQAVVGFKCTVTSCVLQLEAHLLIQCNHGMEHKLNLDTSVIRDQSLKAQFPSAPPPASWIAVDALALPGCYSSLRGAFLQQSLTPIQLPTNANANPN